MFIQNGEFGVHCNWCTEHKHLGRTLAEAQGKAYACLQKTRESELSKVKPQKQEARPHGN